MAADSKAKFLQEAEKYVLHGKVHQAIGEYLKIIKSDPNDVLTLNTIGDLYLRQNNIPEANKYFIQVAESYVRNNFFLKAIAVYRKILSADVNNLDINRTIAELYSKQGLSIDARNQYQKVAILLEKAGRTKEVLNVYEKIVELDPSNSSIQRKLAELHLEAGEENQAHDHFAGAARAQMRARDLAGATDSFGRALQLNALEVDTLSGYLECCQETGNVTPAIDQLKKSLELAPDNLNIRELLGQAYLAANDPETAARTFQMVVSIDESHYEGFFAVTQALIDKEAYDQAISSLDIIIPILITRRETERAAQLYEQILGRCPANILPLVKLASLHSATGDRQSYLDVLDKIADYYWENKCPIEAIEYLEKILHVNPESDKHRKLHQQAYEIAYPDTPYVPPEEPAEPVISPSPAPVRKESETSPGQSSSDLVEVDLLLNYGLKDKALRLLQNLETRDPNDKDVRIRLLNIFKAEDKYAEAAEQCLLLAVLYRRSKDEAAAQEYLSEARQLAPDIAEEQDLDEFARSHGITAEFLPVSAEETDLLPADTEVDLSADLMDIFFVDDPALESSTDSEFPQSADAGHEVATEEYPRDLPQPPSKSIEEQLQEVDFYIRLGFRDEALAKLDEISKGNPDNPELAKRYQKLGGIEQAASGEAASFDPSAAPAFADAAEVKMPEGIDSFPELEVEDASGDFAIIDSGREQTNQVSGDFSASSIPTVEFPAGDEAEEPQIELVPPPEPDKTGFQANEMFADLMDDAGSGAEQDASIDTFEDHFSLGTAYREMELMDEAVKEFQSAFKAASVQKNTQKIIQCCGMLSTCYLKKDMPSSALRWCQSGLGISDISSHEAMALRYDMGVAHSMSGSNERALEYFEWIFGMDPGYRDVAQRIDELKSGSKRHAP